MNEKKKDAKKRRIKAHPHPDQLRNYEAGHTYGGLKKLYFKTFWQGKTFIFSYFYTYFVNFFLI